VLRFTRDQTAMMEEDNVADPARRLFGAS